jgi:hypothetical protein
LGPWHRWHLMGLWHSLPAASPYLDVSAGLDDIMAQASTLALQGEQLGFVRVDCHEVVCIEWCAQLRWIAWCVPYCDYSKVVASGLAGEGAHDRLDDVTRGTGACGRRSELLCQP